ncbi:MAG: histidine kinase [Candidatus Promineifilaceae bacterium]|nr:histidine kinase [Candidatus Promineifilaceae bacterium]
MSEPSELDQRPSQARRHFAELRRRAEEELEARAPGEGPTVLPHDIDVLIHELELHQLELEMQNDELRAAQRELEATRDRYADLYNLAPAGHFTIDRDGNILQVNETGARMLAATQPDVAGRPFSHFVAPAGQDAYYLFRRNLFTEGDTQQCEIEMVPADNVRFHAQLQGKRDPGGEEEEAQSAQAFVVVTDVSERHQAHGKLRRRNRELAALNEFARAVGGALELPEIFTALEEILSYRFDLPGGCLFSYEAPSDTLLLRHHWGLPEAVAEECATLPVAGTHLEPVVRDREAVHFEELQKIPLFIEKGVADARPSWQEHLAVPLLAEGEIEGTLCLFCASGTTFGESRVRFLTTLGQQAGSAIQVARLFSEIRTGHERLRYLTRRVVAAQEEERRRVSRDLHDEAGQVLTALKINLEMIEEDLRTSEEIPGEEMSRQLAAARVLSEKALARLRNLAHNLRPAVLDDLGLGPALEGLCSDFAQQMEGKIDYRQEGEVPPVSGDAKIVLYRFLQEALTNVVKHSQASHVDVLLHANARTVCLAVNDDGVGFDRARTPEGIGLLGMHERVESVGGELEIDSIPGDGTRLTACLPTENT